MNKTIWPELRAYLVREGWRFVAEYIEESWKREESLHEMLEQMVKERNELADKLAKLTTGL